jgi:hypothetical protein
MEKVSCRPNLQAVTDPTSEIHHSDIPPPSLTPLLQTQTTCLVAYGNKVITPAHVVNNIVNINMHIQL